MVKYLIAREVLMGFLKNAKRNRGTAAVRTVVNTSHSRVTLYRYPKIQIIHIFIHNLFNYLKNILQAIIIIIACCGCVVVRWVVVRLRGVRGCVVWFLRLPLLSFQF